MEAQQTSVAQTQSQAARAMGNVIDAFISEGEQSFRVPLPIEAAVPAPSVPTTLVFPEKVEIILTVQVAYRIVD